MSTNAEKLAKLKQEEKILMKLLDRVNEQLSAVRTEEFVIRYHLKTADQSGSQFGVVTAIAHESEPANDSTTVMKESEADLNLEVDETLAKLAKSARETKSSNQENGEEEEEEEDDDEEDYNS